MKTYILTLEDIQDIVENYPEGNYSTEPITRYPDFGVDRFLHKTAVENYIKLKYNHKQQ